MENVIQSSMNSVAPAGSTTSPPLVEASAPSDAAPPEKEGAPINGRIGMELSVDEANKKELTYLPIKAHREILS